MATADILRIISTSPTDLQPVLKVVVQSAARFCGADDVTIFELDQQGDLRATAHWGPIPQPLGVRVPCVHGMVGGRTVLERRPVHVIDLQAEAGELPAGSAFAKRLGRRTTLGVPLLRQGMAVGTIQLRRAEVRPFTDKQIALLKTFADQAAIAIENVHLFEAEQQRTRELSEALEQQTATSEVLRVISSSPGELQPVFDAMLANATRLCEAKFGTLYLRDGDGFHAASLHNAPPAFAENRKRGLIRPGPGTALGRLLRTKQVVCIADVTMEPAYIEGDPLLVTDVKLAGFRTILAVPMLKENELIGGIVIYRQEVRPFTDKQIELVSNFAAQAVIAIENARLLNELRRRTDDLSESLEQQTATSEVLRVISSSRSELNSVFQTILQNAIRICEAKFGTIYQCEGDMVRPIAWVGAPPKLCDFYTQRGAVRPIGDLASLFHTKKTSQLADAAAELPHVASVKLGGARSRVVVPLLKDDDLIGAIVIYRQEIAPFSDKQIALVESFAAQAVIAIENTRLLNELRKRTDDLS